MGGPRRAPPRPPVHSQPSYLALGDSLAFGYSQAKFDSLFPEENPADYETGYVNVFGGVLKLFNPRLQIVNDGCPGETTESFIDGPCAYQLEFPLHHPYTAGPDSSQLADALTYLQTHPGSVNPITIDIGANDALGLIETTCKLEPACIAVGAPRGVRESRRKPRADPRRVARRRAARADHRARPLQPPSGKRSPAATRSPRSSTK